MPLPFFGLLTTRSPMEGLVEHYEKIAESVDVIRDALTCYVAGDKCREITEVAAVVDRIESEADKIKRKIRNHLPRRLLMPVDKTLFFNYTRSQDNVLDVAQDCMYWLSMRPVAVPRALQKDLIGFIEDVCTTLTLLGPALESTIELVYAKRLDRSGVKESFRDVRRNHEKVFKQKNKLLARIYNLDEDFKDIHQMLHFVDQLAAMSHNCESCADILRAMIAR